MGTRIVGCLIRLPDQTPQILVLVKRLESNPDRGVGLIDVSQTHEFGTLPYVNI